MADTLVTFASGAIDGTAEVLQVHQTPSGSAAIIVDQTPFHPVDHTWPDQPGDTGTCGEAMVTDTVMAASGPDAELIIGPDISAKRGDSGWEWYVAHCLQQGSPIPALGETVELRVDAERRRALSAAHSACHLAALAMNLATAHLWRKPVREDSLGSPDLDQIAMQTSVMDVAGSTDTYRLGKSLRKKGFDPVGLADQLDAVVARVLNSLADWLASGAAVVIEDGGDRRVTARREWTCRLPAGQARLACGGTHVRDLTEIEAITVDYRLAADGGALIVRTTPTQRKKAAP